MTGSSDSLQSILAQLDPTRAPLGGSDSSDDFVMIPEIIVQAAPREECGACTLTPNTPGTSSRRRWKSAETGGSVSENQFGGETPPTTPEDRRCRSSMNSRSSNNRAPSPCRRGCRQTRL
eukprot:sb/3476169/